MKKGETELRGLGPVFASEKYKVYWAKGTVKPRIEDCDP